MSVMNARHLLVWLHVVTSLGWMGQALGLFALLVFGAQSGDPAIRLSAFSMADVLDDEVLLYMANSSAFSGLMLSALTPWGYFRYWWVFAKFAITISQLYVGIFILGQRLGTLVEAAEQGQTGSPSWLAVASLLMVSAIAFQAWLSVAKPWKRTPWADAAGKSKKLPTGPRWMFLVSVAAPIVDYLVATFVLGFPLPLLIVLIATGYPFWRSRQLRRTAELQAS